MISRLIFTFFVSLCMACGDDMMEVKEPIDIIDPMLIIEDLLIPMPVSISTGEGVFAISSDVVVSSNGASDELDRIGENFAKLLNRSSIMNATYTDSISSMVRGNIHLEVKENQPAIETEGYRLQVDTNQVTISANSEQGLYYGIQTLRQLLPAEIVSGTIQSVSSMAIPVVSITDYPRFDYRGTMLDVVRHFFTVEDVKRYIDLIAFYKINFLHLHLTDDQGWRLEIKSWPDLTTIGGSTQVGGGEGGFYTQEQYSEIVNYAAQKYITIIPEIDMPGHTNAALASYSDLNCDGIAKELYTGTQVGISTLCLEKESTYEFIEDVIEEVAQITHGQYIHIGGDEVPGGSSTEYNKFISRVKSIVRQNNKTMIGWDEIATSDLDESDVVQHWLDADNVRLARSKRARIIYSPFSQTYLNLRYNNSTSVGASLNIFLNVEDAYSWDPITLLNNQIADTEIWGVEAPVWTEEIFTIKDVEFMTFPRLPGIAEIGWSNYNLRDWRSYRNRLASHQDHFREMKINYYKSNHVIWPE